MGGWEGGGGLSLLGGGGRENGERTGGEVSLGKREGGFGSGEGGTNHMG